MELDIQGDFDACYIAVKELTQLSSEEKVERTLAIFAFTAI